MTTLLLDGSVAFGLTGALYAATIAYVAVIAVNAKSAARRRDARDTLAILTSAKAQTRLAKLRRDQSRPEEAIAVVQASLAIFRQRDDLRWQAQALTLLGALHADNHDPDRARENLTDALAIYQDINVPAPRVQGTAVRHGSTASS